MGDRQIIIRSARLKDAAGIAHVHVEAWRSAYRELLPADLLARLSVERRLNYWEQTLSTPDSDHVPFVAANGDQIVGFVLVGPAREIDPAQNWGELLAIYLLEDWCGCGVGWQLWRAGAEELARKNYETIMLWVLDGNQQAIRFYERIGFSRDQSDSGVKIEQMGNVTVREHRYVYNSTR